MTRILLVDDNVALVRVMAGILQGMGQLQFATDGHAALARMREQRPDLVLLDAEMPGLDGLGVCVAMKSDPTLAGIPVIFVTGHTGAEAEARGRALGAADFLVKPVNAELLRARVRAGLLAPAADAPGPQAADVDVLTGLPNRLGFDTALDHAWAGCRRHGRPIALLTIDIDHFGRYNTRHGRDAGDRCLCEVARALRTATAAPADVLARVDGDTFALLLPGTPATAARDLATGLLGAVGRLAIPHAASPSAQVVTVGIGVAVAGDTMPLDPRALLTCADLALARAQAEGGARAWVSPVHADGAGQPLSELCRWTELPC